MNGAGRFFDIRLWELDHLRGSAFIESILKL